MQRYWVLLACAHDSRRAVRARRTSDLETGQVELAAAVRCSVRAKTPVKHSLRGGLSVAGPSCGCFRVLVPLPGHGGRRLIAGIAQLDW
jgi:hypothetical protein